MFSDLSSCNSTPYVGSSKSGRVSGIPVPSSTFEKVQSCSFEITPSHKLLYPLSAMQMAHDINTIPALRHIINTYITLIGITSRHCRLYVVQLTYNFDIFNTCVTTGSRERPIDYPLSIASQKCRRHKSLIDLSQGTGGRHGVQFVQKWCECDFGH